MNLKIKTVVLAFPSPQLPLPSPRPPSLTPTLPLPPPFTHHPPFVRQVIGKQLFSWEEISSALLRYKELHVTTDKWTVPTSYIIADGDDRFDPSVWGLRLGRTVSNVRSQNSYRAHRVECEAMGLDCTSQKLDGRKVILALRLYKELHVDPASDEPWTVPQSFVVPSIDAWPQSLWGLKLGLAGRNIRNKDSFREYRGELESLGFDFVVVGEHPSRSLSFLFYSFLFFSILLFSFLFFRSVPFLFTTFEC